MSVNLSEQGLTALDPKHLTAAVTELDANDAADAQALLRQLMRTSDSEEDTVSERARLAEFSALITAFNSSIQEESKDRKYRFRVKRLMKGHQG